ncbi:hypothetical protein [Nonomuraea fuscirosea]|uniref:hypothetical protein n=1 Tax=Nonomuraea fuscirosea TaxID=1291556 RepID=UPI0033C3E3BB
MTRPTAARWLSSRIAIAVNSRQFDARVKACVATAVRVDTEEITVREGGVWASLYRHQVHHPGGDHLTFWEVVDRYTVPPERETLLTPGGVGQTVRVYTSGTTAAAVWTRILAGAEGDSDILAGILRESLAARVRRLAPYRDDAGVPDRIQDGDDPRDTGRQDALAELDAALEAEQATGEVPKRRLRMYAVAMWRAGRHNVKAIADRTGLDRANTVYPALREAGIDPATDRVRN